MKKAVFAGLLCLVAALVIITWLRMQEENGAPLSSKQKQYCEQVEQWRDQEMLGVASEYRAGHPDMQGTYDEWCQRALQNN